MIATRGSENSSAATVLPKVPVVADTKGRLRVSKAQRRDILAALDRSNESVPQFARRTGLKYSTGTGLVLQLPGGAHAEVGDEKQAVLAAILVRALTQPC